MKPPAIKETKFSNGLTLIHLHTKSDPISACHLFFPNGTDRESTPKAGVTTLMWSLLSKGTKNRSAQQIAEDIESIGAAIGGGATHDYSEISCHAVSEYFLPAIEIMSEMLFKPAYVPSEVEKEKAALLAGIRSKKENIFTVANETFNTQLYGNHPYARPPTGTVDTVSKLKTKDLLNWHREMVVPQGALLSVASNLSFSEIKSQVEKLFGPSLWKKRQSKLIKKLKKTPSIKSSHSTRLLEKFEQAYLLLGYSAPGITSKDYVPLKILNACLGGGMSARLFQQLREQEGLAYDVGAFYASKKCGSAFVTYMGLQPAKLEEAKSRILKILKEVSSTPVSKQELTETKNYIKGTFLMDHQTNSQRSHYLGWWKILGLGQDFDKRYISLVDKVSPKDIQRVAKKVLRGKSITIEIYPEKLAK
ncbi:MAG: putative zinc protease [Elusimicrobia bacterium]|nr:putative zinc protease [Elusimicrobiota bacterium]